MIKTGLFSKDKTSSAQDVVGQALSLAEKLPTLMQDARRLAGLLNHGIHGRKQSGPGENFWQFRPFTAGEPASRIDWRCSARDQKLYIREREWEAARTIWIWVDHSQSMSFSSHLALAAKIDRAVILALALAKVLCDTGECVGLAGSGFATTSRHIIDKMAQSLSLTSPDNHPLPSFPIGRRDEVILFSDFLMPIQDIQNAIAHLSQTGAHGHLVTIIDPIEESFPFEGQTILYEDENHIRLTIGDAAAWRKEYQTHLAAFRSQLTECAMTRGWSITFHRTDRAATETALKLVTLLGNTRHAMGVNKSKYP